METLASGRAASNKAAQRFIAMGLEVTPLPIFAEPSFTDKNWLSRLSYELEACNLGLRGGDAGRKAFGVRCSVDAVMNRAPLDALESYRFLRAFDTLRFETPTWAVFVFLRDSRYIEVSENSNLYLDQIRSGPLKDSRLVTSGWLGFGSILCDGKAAFVTSEGEMRDCRQFPPLLEALSQSGKFRVFTL